MRDILHKTKEILQGRGKTILIKEHSQDKDCTSDVHKSFIYVAKEVDSQEELGSPQVHIDKFFDSLNADEHFSFRVRGAFYVNRNRRLMKVGYCHTLRIRLHWKDAKLSPKKTVTMA